MKRIFSTLIVLLAFYNLSFTQIYSYPTSEMLVTYVKNKDHSYLEYILEKGGWELYNTNVAPEGIIENNNDYSYSYTRRIGNTTERLVFIESFTENGNCLSVFLTTSNELIFLKDYFNIREKQTIDDINSVVTVFGAPVRPDAIKYDGSLLVFDILEDNNNSTYLRSIVYCR